MNVKDLIEQLKKHDQDRAVVFKQADGAHVLVDTVAPKPGPGGFVVLTFRGSK